MQLISLGCPPVHKAFPIGTYYAEGLTQTCTEDNKTWICVKFSVCPGSFGRSLTSPSMFANIAVFMMSLPFTTSHLFHYQRHYHFRQQVQSPPSAWGTLPAGCNWLPSPACQAQPTQTCHQSPPHCFRASCHLLASLSVLKMPLL